METVFGSIIETDTWMPAGISLTVFVLAAAPAVMLLRGNKVAIACAVILLISAMLLLVLNLTGLQYALALAMANLLLVSINLSHTRKRVSQMKDGLEALEAAVRNLETAEERRRAFNAQLPLEAANTVSDRVKPIKKPGSPQGTLR